jgi:hypothetical protein
LRAPRRSASSRVTTSVRTVARCELSGVRVPSTTISTGAQPDGDCSVPSGQAGDCALAVAAVSDETAVPRTIHGRRRGTMEGRLGTKARPSLYWAQRRLPSKW